MIIAKWTSTQETKGQKEHSIVGELLTKKQNHPRYGYILYKTTQENEKIMKGLKKVELQWEWMNHPRYGYILL